jgi:hypothetical protein
MKGEGVVMKGFVFYKKKKTKIEAIFHASILK